MFSCVCDVLTANSEFSHRFRTVLKAFKSCVGQNATRFPLEGEGPAPVGVCSVFNKTCRRRQWHPTCNFSLEPMGKM